jgi:geranylgeranyl diphosphate synthase type II
MILFNKTALQVCEGQQYDIDFEIKNDVQIEDYIKMITSKTAILVACSLKMGAMIANASKEDSDNIYQFGLLLGIAFQLQDDYLDTFGNQDTFGKKIGGDILENKKTFLYLKALELASVKDRKELQVLFSTNKNSNIKIKNVTTIYKKYNIDVCIIDEVDKTTKLAYQSLDKTTLSLNQKTVFKALGDNLLTRSY